MDKRTFLKFGAAFTASSFVSGILSSCGGTKPTAQVAKAAAAPLANIPAPNFELPPLPFGTSALEPLIDSKTMEIHHGKHHAAYVKNLNAALTGKMVSANTLEGILRNVTAEEGAIRNHGGGHFNHMLYWQTMQPGGAPNPRGLDIGKAIDAQFGSFEALHEKMVKAATGVFGSGWAWLAVGADKKLFVSTTPNQDNPLMANLVKETGMPILGIDVWEHAYYLKHQNKRADYITNFMQLINWEVVNEGYKKAV
jgi:superoxide dismutase, Fe-Mn family